MILNAIVREPVSSREEEEADVEAAFWTSVTMPDACAL